MLPGLHESLSKLSEGFVPVTKLEKAVAKKCHNCNEEPSYKPAQTADIKLAALAEELFLVGAITDIQHEAICKQAEGISQQEARHSLQRLKRMNETSPTIEDIGRGSMVGATVSPVASIVGRALTGDPLLGERARQVQGIRRVGMGARNLSGAATMGAFFGGVMPALKSRLDRQAEEGKLRNYLTQQEPINA